MHLGVEKPPAMGEWLDRSPYYLEVSGSILTPASKIASWTYVHDFSQTSSPFPILPAEPNPQKFTTEVTLMYLTQLSKAFEFHNTLLKRFAGLT